MSERTGTYIGAIAEQHGLTLPAGDTALNILGGNAVKLANTVNLRRDIAVSPLFREEFNNAIKPAREFLEEYRAKLDPETPDAYGGLDLGSYWTKFQDHMRPKGRITGEVTDLEIRLKDPSLLQDERLQKKAFAVNPKRPHLEKISDSILPLEVSGELKGAGTVSHLFAVYLAKANKTTSAGYVKDRYSLHLDMLQQQVSRSRGIYATPAVPASRRDGASGAVPPIY